MNRQGRIHLKYVADPAPIVVTQDKPQLPVLTFAAYKTLLAAGKWKGALIAEQKAQPTLVGEFCLDLSPTDIEELSKGGSNYVALRNDQPQGFASPGSSFKLLSLVVKPWALTLL